MPIKGEQVKVNELCPRLLQLIGTDAKDALDSEIAVVADALAVSGESEQKAELRGGLTKLFEQPIGEETTGKPAERGRYGAQPVRAQKGWGWPVEPACSV